MPLASVYTQAFVASSRTVYMRVEERKLHWVFHTRHQCVHRVERFMTVLRVAHLQCWRLGANADQVSMQF